MNSALFTVLQKGGPTLYFICHCCFSFLQQCAIVAMKISGSMNRRILYYYVPAKFRSLFSFSCSQRAHNLLSTMRQATKLHCCSANRVVLVDGLTRCEVCLSTAAATEAFLGTPSPSRTRKKEKGKERNWGRTTSSFSCLRFFSQFGWFKDTAVLEEMLSFGVCVLDSQHPLCSSSSAYYLWKNDAGP